MFSFRESCDWTVTLSDNSVATYTTFPNGSVFQDGKFIFHIFHNLFEFQTIKKNLQFKLLRFGVIRLQIIYIKNQNFYTKMWFGTNLYKFEKIKVQPQYKRYLPLNQPLRTFMFCRRKQPNSCSINCRQNQFKIFINKTL